jgi:hypothetical protein
MRESDKLNYKNDDIFENLKTIRDMEGIFKNVNYIYIYIYIYIYTRVQVSVCCKEKKKEQNLLFQRERNIRSGEEKQIQNFSIQKC